MQFSLSVAQKNSLIDFYNRLSSHGNQWAGRTEDMLCLIEAIEQANEEGSFQVFTSHESLAIAWPFQAPPECIVRITPEGGGRFQIQYCLHEQDSPWKWVIGFASDTKQAVVMISDALSNSGKHLTLTAP